MFLCFGKKNISFFPDEFLLHLSLLGEGIFHFPLSPKLFGIPAEEDCPNSFYRQGRSETRSPQSEVFSEALLSTANGGLKQMLRSRVISEGVRFLPPMAV